MARLRYNGLSTTLGASLTSSATSVTFAAALTHSGGTNVPTISGDYIPLSILDASGRLSEIVYLTAYTAGATTGTITRAQEATTGVSHASGDKIAHGTAVLDVKPRVAKYNGPNTVDLTTTSTSAVALGSYSISVPANVGDEVEITLTGSLYSSGALSIDFQFYVNGAAVGPIWRHNPNGNTIVKADTFVYLHTVQAGDLASGVVPIVPKWKVSAGTGFWADAAGIFGQLTGKNFGQ